MKIKFNHVDNSNASNELKETCEEYIKWLDSNDYNEDEKLNYENDIFEKALELFYGEDIWEYINKRIV